MTWLRTILAGSASADATVEMVESQRWLTKLHMNKTDGEPVVADQTTHE